MLKYHSFGSSSIWIQMWYMSYITVTILTLNLSNLCVITENQKSWSGISWDRPLYVVQTTSSRTVVLLMFMIGNTGIIWWWNIPTIWILFSFSHLSYVKQHWGRWKSSSAVFLERSSHPRSPVTNTTSFLELSLHIPTILVVRSC